MAQKVHNWTCQEISVLRETYAETPTARIAERLDLSVRKVYAKAHQLGLKKSAAYLATPDSGRLMRGSDVGFSGRFVAGGRAWNKGMKGLDIGGKETRFKKGHRGGRAAENYKPIGTERISKDGYVQRKVNDDLPLQARWKFVHTLVWEAANGPVPPGHAITFLDGNRKNTALENLQIVKRADLMRRNTVHNYGPEIAQLVRLRGAITRQINRKERTEA